MGSHDPFLPSLFPPQGWGQGGNKLWAGARVLGSSPALPHGPEVPLPQGSGQTCQFRQAGWALGELWCVAGLTPEPYWFRQPAG